ncbi:MAG: S9 family peptidase [Provencibacterium sp.]|nr:S9 family peptidase [Provencibacterium sp.]
MQRIELRDFLRYQFLSSPEFSPNGKKAAFVVSQCDEGTDGYRSFIHLYDCESGESTRLTGGGKEKQFVWLDDRTLLFSGLRDKALQEKNAAGEPWTAFYSLSIDGGEAQEYMRVPAKVLNFVPVTADLFALLCAFQNDRKNPHDYEGAEKEAVLKELQKEKDYWVCDEIPFRHNGPGFHNGTRARLYLFDRRDGSMKPVSDPWQQVEFIRTKENEILFTAMHFYKERRMGLSTGVYLYDIPSGKTAELVAEDLYRLRFCDYMGDGVVFAGSDMKSWGPNENPHFFRVSREGKLTRMAENQESACNSVGSDCRYGGGADFRCEGDAVYFLSTQGGNAVVMRAHADGSIETLTPANGTVDSFDVHGGELLYVGMKGDRLQELYTFKEGREERRTGFNEWVQTDRTLSTPERFTFQSEGNTIEGYVIKPVGFDPAKKYPAVLDIHGGHKCAYGPVFYHEMQLWANEGWFVIFCNPRGSDGGGNTFAEIIDRYGEIDYVDIMNFTDECIARYPQIDTAKMAVTGGSYGGYMTNWVIGHTDRFCCAASQRSISNFFSEFGTADTGYYFPLKQFVGSNPWDHTDRYWFHSPLAYANRCKTPTLFIHSEEDYRCPLQEGIQMFTALKFHQVDARLVVFRGENHELSRGGKPSHRERRLSEITGWFRHYLNG